MIEKASWQAPLISIFSLCLLVLISPAFIGNPYLISEEGTVYFNYAWTTGFWKALFTPQLGYLSFWANFSTATASLLPLDYAPWTCSIFGITCLSILIYLIIYSWGEPENLASKLVFILLLFLVPAGHGKLFANFTHFYWTLIAFVIAASDPRNRLQRCTYPLLMLIAGISSPSACFILPALAYRALRDDDAKYSACLLLALSIAMIIQTSVVIFGWSAIYPEEYQHARFQSGPLAMLSVSLSSKFLASLFGGPWLMNLTGSKLSSFIYRDPIWGRVIALVILTVISAFWLLAVQLAFKKNHSIKQEVLAITLACVTLGSILTGMTNVGPIFRMGIGEIRYYYIPGVLLGLILMEAIITLEKRRILLPSLALVWMLISGLVQYFIIYRPQYVWLSNGPSWKNEVLAWKEDASHPLSIRPLPQHIYLKKSH